MCLEINCVHLFFSRLFGGRLGKRPADFTGYRPAEILSVAVAKLSRCSVLGRTRNIAEQCIVNRLCRSSARHVQAGASGRRIPAGEAPQRRVRPPRVAERREGARAGPAAFLLPIIMDEIDLVIYGRYVPESRPPRMNMKNYGSENIGKNSIVLQHRICR